MARIKEKDEWWQLAQPYNRLPQSGRTTVVLIRSDVAGREQPLQGFMHCIPRHGGPETSIGEPRLPNALAICHFRMAVLEWLPCASDCLFAGISMDQTGIVSIKGQLPDRTGVWPAKDGLP